MPTLTHRVARAIRAGALWGGDDRVAVALSGGADSVALTLLLADLARQASWSLAGVIHVHHGLRGHEADQDATFCRQLAGRLALPIEVVDVDVRSAMARSRRSVEATARTLRYAALESAARTLGASVVATGHTADDQAETVLLRLLRGSATRGVSAIRPRLGAWVRPLLGLRRQELRAFLVDRSEPWRDDASNLDLSVPRNRLRQALMPVIDRDWPGGVRALARFAELAADDERWLSARALRAAAGLVRIGPDGVELIREALNALPVALSRRVVRQALEAAGGSPVLREVEAVRRLARVGPDGRGEDLHGLRVDCTQDRLLIGPPHGLRAAVPFEYRLDVPGEVRIVETGAMVRASFVTGTRRPSSSVGWDDTAVVQASGVRLPLTVRSRGRRDRLFPLGAPGSRRLQDLLVDRKIPRADRSVLPIVLDADGQIVWVAGVAVSERGRVLEPEAGMVILDFKKGTP